MDDLSSKINQILSDPESVNQLRAVAASLGLGGGEAPPSPAAQAPQQPPASTPPPAAPTPPPSSGAAAPPPGTPDLSALSSLIASLGGGARQNTAAPPPPMIDPATLGVLASALGKMNAPNENVNLLQALRPHFSEGRRSRIDDAIRIIQLISLLPVIRETGIFGSLFGGEKK